MSQEKLMTKRVWGLTDRGPCGSADREDKGNNKERVGHEKDDQEGNRKLLQIVPVRWIPVWVVRRIIIKTIRNKGEQ